MVFDGQLLPIIHEAFDFDRAITEVLIYKFEDFAAWFVIPFLHDFISTHPLHSTEPCFNNWNIIMD